MTPQQQNELGEALPDRAKPKVAAQLLEVALTDYAFVKDMEGQAFAVAQDGPSIALPLRGESSYRKRLAKDFHTQTGQVVNASALTDALLILDARVEGEIPRRVHQRVAITETGILLDLGRPDYQVVDVSPHAWQIRPLNGSDPLFRRSRAMGVMPLPEADGDLNSLWEVVNVRPADRPVLAAFMAASFLPEVAQPFVLLKGEQGTGKTTAAKMLLSLLDPGPGQMTSTPRTEKDFAVAARGHTVLGVDNLSTITPALSDMICRAVTGESIVSRALYTDDGVSILSYRIGLIISSIDPGALRGDLAERMLPIQLEPILKGRRVEQELWASFTRALPGMLGAVLDLVVVALRHLPTVGQPEVGWPRMADFGKLLAALDVEYGTTGLASYTQMILDSELDVVSGDPLSDALLRLAGKEPAWKGTPTELLTDLLINNDYTPEERRGWRTAQEMCQTLARLSRGLRLAGLEVTSGKSNGRRYVELRMKTTRL